MSSKLLDLSACILSIGLLSIVPRGQVHINLLTFHPAPKSGQNLNLPLMAKILAELFAFSANLQMSG